MIIVIYGDNTFSVKRKLKAILKDYRKKHKSGLSFFSFFSDDFDFLKFKDASTSSSMFEEKKCIVVYNIFSDKKEDEKIISFLKERDFKNNKDVVFIFIEKTPKDNDRFNWLCEKPSLVQKFDHLSPLELKSWIENEAKENNAKIEKDAIEALVGHCGSDLWRIYNEIMKLSSYDKIIKKDTVNMFISSKDEGDIFKAIDFLQNKNKKEALKIFSDILESGKNISYLISMLAFQFRNFIKIKEFLDLNESEASIAKKTKLHPFIVKKSINKVKAYSFDELLDIYKKIEEADRRVKSTQIDSRLIFDNLVLSLK